MAPPGGFWVLFDSKKYQGELSIKIIEPSAIYHSIVAEKSGTPRNHYL